MKNKNILKYITRWLARSNRVCWFVVTSDQINYEQKMFSHPSYRFEPQFPNTFGQPINLGASQTPSVINLPPEVFNLAQSYLLYTVTLPAGAAYIWYALQALKEISTYNSILDPICGLQILITYKII